MSEAPQYSETALQPAATLADPTRRAILARAGLVSRGRDAQRRPCRIEAKPLEAAHAWIERYREMWDITFARLDALLEKLQHPDGQTKSPKRSKKK